MTDYVMRYVYNHVEVYDRYGEFQFSADTEQEAWEELQELSEAVLCGV